MRTTEDFQFQPGPALGRAAAFALPPGPGTDLHRLLETKAPDEACGRLCVWLAVECNERGAAWCADHVDVILGWLANGARDQGAPFLEDRARAAVRQAIPGAG